MILADTFLVSECLSQHFIDHFSYSVGMRSTFEESFNANSPIIKVRSVNNWFNLLANFMVVITFFHTRDQLYLDYSTIEPPFACRTEKKMGKKVLQFYENCCDGRW